MDGSFIDPLLSPVRLLAEEFTVLCQWFRTVLSIRKITSSDWTVNQFIECSIEIAIKENVIHSKHNNNLANQMRWCIQPIRNCAASNLTILSPVDKWKSEVRTDVREQWTSDVRVGLISFTWLTAPSPIGWFDCPIGEPGYRYHYHHSGCSQLLCRQLCPC